MKQKSEARLSRTTRRPKLSLANPPTDYTMSVDDLAELTGMSRNQAYISVNRGVYPSIRGEKKGSVVKVLTVPTLAILRGEIPPGPSRGRAHATPDRRKDEAAGGAP